MAIQGATIVSQHVIDDSALRAGLTRNEQMIRSSSAKMNQSLRLDTTIAQRSVTALNQAIVLLGGNTGTYVITVGYAVVNLAKLAVSFRQAASAAKLAETSIKAVNIATSATVGLEVAEIAAVRKMNAYRAAAMVGGPSLAMTAADQRLANRSKALRGVAVAGAGVAAGAAGSAALGAAAKGTVWTAASAAAPLALGIGAIAGMWIYYDELVELTAKGISKVTTKFNKSTRGLSREFAESAILHEKLSAESAALAARKPGRAMLDASSDAVAVAEGRMTIREAKIRELTRGGADLRFAEELAGNEARIRGRGNIGEGNRHAEQEDAEAFQRGEATRIRRAEEDAQSATEDFRRRDLERLGRRRDLRGTIDDLTEQQLRIRAERLSIPQDDPTAGFGLGINRGFRFGQRAMGNVVGEATEQRKTNDLLTKLLEEEKKIEVSLSEALRRLTEEPLTTGVF